MKPDALVFGFPRCGSTSLWWYFHQHPECHEVDKELHYWSQGQDQGITRTHEDYLSQFSDTKFNVDVSPYTVYWWKDSQGRERVIERLLEHNPEIKLICLLRHPLDRMVSEYYKDRENFLRKKKKMDPAEFAKMMQNPHQLNGVLNNKWNLENGTFPDLNRFVVRGELPPQFTRSMYSRHLKKWVELTDKDQILFVKYEDLTKDPATHLKRICDFLGISCYSDELPKLMSFSHMKEEREKSKDAPAEYWEKPWKQHATKHNKGRERYPKLHRGVRAMLWQKMWEDMVALKEMTGVDYDTRKKPDLEPELPKYLVREIYWSQREPKKHWFQGFTPEERQRFGFISAR